LPLNRDFDVFRNVEWFIELRAILEEEKAEKERERALQHEREEEERLRMDQEAELVEPADPNNPNN
jgi:hypothetical protein